MKEYSKNKAAEDLMGRRDTGAIPFDEPCALGYKCPVCKYRPLVSGNYDERLHWSEYNGFLWCSVCDKDYPSALCHPDIDRAISIFLDTVREAVITRHEKSE